MIMGGIAIFWLVGRQVNNRRQTSYFYSLLTNAINT